MNTKNTHIVTIGWERDLIDAMWDRIQLKGRIRFSHLVLTSNQVRAFGEANGREDVVPIRPEINFPLPPPDLDLLASLQGEGIPTIHNMILGDRVLAYLPWDEVYSYLTFLARRLIEMIGSRNPDIVLGGFDSAHSGVGLAVCRKLGIPYVAMGFTVIPPGLMGFCSGLLPDELLPITRPMDESLRTEADEVYNEFLAKKPKVYAYLSPHTLSMRLKQFPGQARRLVSRLIAETTGRRDKFTWPSNSRRVLEYARRLRNQLLLPRRIFTSKVPQCPFALFALQMVPESSIDTWAPFYADQRHVIAQIVRALPPNIKLLVKIHYSDMDNYSPRQLRAYTDLPGVELIAPLASSRDFVEKATLVFGIQGTICLESALLGKPVLMFGESPYQHFPTVTKVGRITELPAQIKKALDLSKPSREEILDSFVCYLSRYMPGILNDWSKSIGDTDIDRLAQCFERLCDYIADPAAAENRDSSLTASVGDGALHP